MFKNRLDAAKQLKEKIEPELDQKSGIKIISLTQGGKKIAKYLQKLLSPTFNHQHPNIILIVDDGSVSVDKLIHAIKLYRRKNVKRILIGLPVYKHEEVRKLEKTADALFTIIEPKNFISIEEFYQDLE